MKKFVKYPTNINCATVRRKRNAVYGNPTIKWSPEDEERYSTVGPNVEDKADLAAYVAYVLDSDGYDLFAFADEDEWGNWLIDIDGNGRFRWYEFTMGRLFPTNRR